MALSPKSNPRGYIQRGRETFSPEARQMLFRFMIDSNEETGQNHGAPRSCAAVSGSAQVIEDPEYLGGFHLEPKGAEGSRFERQSPQNAEGFRLERPLAGYHHEPETQSPQVAEGYRFEH